MIRTHGAWNTTRIIGSETQEGSLLATLSSIGSTSVSYHGAPPLLQLMASDAVNLSLLTSGVPDSDIMMSNTKLAFRVGPDLEQQELFEELYDTCIQAHQMNKFRQKRGQTVSAIRAEGVKQYKLPATGTEDWSKVTSELLAGKYFRCFQRIGCT